jgi:TolB-like protein/DNA-binding winged helix-turn-helix (wHTH) protein
MKYLLHDLIIDTGRQSISRGDGTIKMTKLSYDFFLVLIRAAPDLVSSEDLMRQVWPQVVVSADTVTKRVTLVREALGDDSSAPRYIVGLRGRGYQIAGTVSIMPEEPMPALPSVDPPAAHPVDAGAGDEPHLPLSDNQSDLPTDIEAAPWARPSLRKWKLPGISTLFALLLAAAVFIAEGHWRPASSDSAAASASRQGLSIAVIPFRDLSPNASQQYFADGVAEELIGLLADTTELVVIDRTSSFQFRGNNQDVGRIARELGVSYVLRGSVARSGQRVRLSVQLIDSRDGSDRWSSVFDREFTELFQVQDEISHGVARALQLSMGIDDLRMAERSPTNPAAYGAYLKGRLAMDRVDRESLEIAAAFTQQALDLDPKYVSALVSLSEIRLLQAEWAFLPATAAFNDSESLAESTIKIAHQNGQAHAILAEIYAVRDWNWARAQAEFDRAVALNARDSGTLLVGARLAAAIGNWADAARFAIAAKAENPLSPMVQNAVGSVLYRMGRNDEAIKAFQKALTIDPSFNMGHFNLAKAELAAGHLEAALAAAAAEEAGVANNGRNAGIAMVRFAMNDRQGADKALEELKKDAANTWPFGVAQVYSFRGDADEAFAWLNRAYDLKDEIIRARGDPVFHSIEHDPRYAAFLQRLDRPTEVAQPQLSRSESIQIRDCRQSNQPVC